jgi:hypothetical protein
MASIGNITIAAFVILSYSLKQKERAEERKRERKKMILY